VAARYSQTRSIYETGGHGGPPLQLIRAGQQFLLDDFDLRVDHSEDVQLAAPSKGEMLHGVREHFGFVGVLHRSHEHEQCGCRLIASPTDYLCQCLDILFS